MKISYKLTHILGHKKLPFFLLLISGIIFSFNFQNRFDPPLHDETVYAKGSIYYHGGWGPLYSFVYLCLNSLTVSPLDSFHIILLFLTFFITPVLVYFIAQKLSFSRRESFILGFISMIAFWNFPSEPKIQLFNLCFILTAVLIRWASSATNIKLSIFYFIMGASLFIRQDNLIIIGVFIFYDFLLLMKNWSWKSFSTIILSIFASFSSLFFFMQSPFDSRRSLYAFLDHFGWRNGARLHFLLPKEKDPFTEILNYFHNPSTLKDAFLARPSHVLEHLLNNLSELHLPIIKNFTFILGLPSTILWLIFLIVFVLISCKEKPVDNILKKESAVLGLSIALKCIFVSLILQPWPKYSFELNIVLLFLIAYFIKYFKKRFSVKQKADFLFLGIPLLLIFTNFQAKVFSNNFDINTTLKLLSKIKEESVVRTTLCNGGISMWLDNMKTSSLSLNLVRDYDQIIKKDLNLFFEQAEIDLIVLESDYRWMISHHGLQMEFKHFEENFSKYGFSLVHGKPTEGLAIYKRE